MAALGPDSARAAPQVRAAVTESLQRVLDTIAGEMPDPDALDRRRRAIGLFASLVGALVVARAVDDRALSDEILEAVRAQTEASLR
jgi:TetR/AcrR family transcriptional repressor of nem operon